MCNRRPFSDGCFREKPAPNGVTLMSLVISVHSKVGVSRPRTRTGKCSGRRSRIRFQFRSSLMGADGHEKRSEKRRECYTKLLILLEFSPVLGLPATAKKAKIQATLIVMFHPFFFSSKAPNPSSVSLAKGPDCVADCIGKVSRWKQV